MAKNTQEAEVIVTLNGQAAKRAIEDMVKEYDRLTKAALDAYKAGDDALGKKLDAQAQKLTKDMEITRRETKKFAEIMKNINGASLKELRSAAKQLQSEINKLSPGTQEFITKSKQLQQVNTRIRQLTSSFKGLVEEEKAASLSIKGLTESFNKYFAIATAGIAAITGVSMAFRQCAEEAAKLDDTYADVMKTTGLMKEQVSELDKELMKINTRTSREQLLLLARDAGKLGITGKENILGFVRAADQIQVALGEDLGEGAIKQLGKIADVLGYTQSMGIERSLLSIASSINAVGQASTASEAYLVEFTQRLAGVAAQTNISAANIIGFASGLDQSAMKVEMAATAFQKFIMKIYEDPAKFAEYANMQVEQFADLLKNDANQAIITILKSLKDKDGFSALVPIFQDMGLDGARAVSVLAAMATNITAVTDAQALANQEFAKATSVTEEYNTKNNNLQAQLEKARKEFQNARIELGQKLNPVLLKSTKAVTYLIKVLASHGKEIRNAIIAVAALTAAIKAQAIADAVRTNALKLWNTVSKTAEFLSNKLFAAYYRLTGQTLKYAAAQRAANAAASKSVYGLIAIAVGTLAYKLTELNEKTEEHVEVTEEAKSVEEKIAETYAEEQGRIEVLTKMVNNNNLSLDDRRAALLRLKEIVPGYHAELTQEGILIDNNTEAIERYLQKFKEKIRLQAYEDTFAENEKKLVETQLKLEKKKEEKQKMIQDNGGEYPDTHVSKKNKYFTLTGTLGPFLGTYADRQLGLITEEVSSFGNLLNEINDLERDVNKYKSEKKRLGDKLDDLYKEDETKMQEEILDINRKYEEIAFDLEKRFALDAGTKLKLERQRFAEIEEVKKKYESITGTESRENDNLTQAQFDFLQERYDKLTKKEKKLIDKGYASLTDDEAKALRARYTKLTAANTKLNDQRYQQAVKDLEKAKRGEENILKEKYINNKVTAEQYEKEMRDINLKYLEQKVLLAKEYGEDETVYMQAMLDAQIEAQQLAAKEMDRLAKEADDKLKKEHEKILEEKRRLDELTKEGEEVRASLRTPSEVRNDEMSAELARLDKLHRAKILSEKEYEKAIQQLRKKYADEDLREKLSNVQKYTEKSNSILAEAANVVSAIRDAELAQAEANYQADLTAAGDNAERREQVETEYEKKKLEIQKKYADADMAINIAKTIAAGALAAIQAFAQLGPIGGAVAAALIAVITAADVATIVAQRNAIKATSVNSSSSTGTSSSSSIETGTRSMTGYAEGGYTEDHTTLTTVGELGTEWIAPHWLVQEHPVTFASLERYRRAGSHGRSGSIRQGFADGGFTDPTSSSMMSAAALQEIDFQAMREFNDIMRYCSTHGVFVKYGDILIAKGKYENFKKETSR